MSDEVDDAFLKAELAESNLPYTKLVAPDQHATETVEITQADYAELPAVISQMTARVKASKGIGLAGPQVGYNKRIFIVRESAPDEKNEDPWDVCINPELEGIPKQGRSKGEEGCLTFPGELYTVERWDAIKLKWYTPIFSEDGKAVLRLRKIENEIFGGWARVAQHEYDHLFGRLVNKTGVLVDQTKMLEDAAALAGLTYNKDTGEILRKDVTTGQMVPMDKDAAILEITNIQQAQRDQAKISALHKEYSKILRAEKKKIKDRRKKERQNKKKARKHSR